MDFSDPDFQKQLFSGGLTNIATLLILLIYKLIVKGCDKNKRSDCTLPCGFSCHSVNRTIHGKREIGDLELGPGFSQENGEGMRQLHFSDD